jgi:hypothetical protein
VVLARQTTFGDIGEHGAHDTAQGVLGQEVIADVIDGHGGNPLVARCQNRQP